MRSASFAFAGLFAHVATAPAQTIATRYPIEQPPRDEARAQAVLAPFVGIEGLLHSRRIAVPAE